MRDDHVLQSFLTAPKTILGGILLFIAAVIVGQIVFLITRAWGEGGWFPVVYLPDIPFDLLFVFGFGAMSGVGLIFLCLDFWWIYRLTFKDESPKRFFWAVVGNQVALGVCSLFVESYYFQTIPSLIVASILIYGTYHDLRMRVLSGSTEM